MEVIMNSKNLYKELPTNIESLKDNLISVLSLVSQDIPSYSQYSSMKKFREMTFPVVTLIGSTKFKKEFEEVKCQLGYNGCIVQSVSFFSHSLQNSNVCMYGSTKRMFDAGYLKYIDNTDICIVLNIGGYIGLGAWDEIYYTIAKNKKLYFIEPVSQLCANDIITLCEKEQAYTTLRSLNISNV